MYGGPSDPSSGHKGADGTTLDGTMSIAELGMGAALGHLPYGTELYVNYNGKTVKAVKHDIGLGGIPIQGHARRIDLWYETANALGFSGTGLVTVARVDGKPINGPHDTAQLDSSRFGQLAPTRAGVKAGGAAGNAIANAVQTLANVFKSIFQFLSKLFSIRGLEVALGLVLATASLVMLAKRSGYIPRI